MVVSNPGSQPFPPPESGLYLVAGAQAPDGNLWASLLVGAPGFARTIDSYHLHLLARPAPADPLAGGPTPIGLLALGQPTRSRIRVNGTATPTDQGILVTVEQVFGNCTKYIGTRVPVEVIDGGRPDPARRSGTALTAEQAAFLHRSDTAFVASAHAERGADASHRGGRPGSPVARCSSAAPRSSSGTAQRSPGARRSTGSSRSRFERLPSRRARCPCGSRCASRTS